jgi:hypothetical protein
LADVSRTTVGYQKHELEREGVEAFRELAQLRQERDEARKSYISAVKGRQEFRRAMAAERARAEAAERLLRRIADPSFGSEGSQSRNDYVTKLAAEFIAALAQEGK